jgi:hypothetical protein
VQAGRFWHGEWRRTGRVPSVATAELGVSGVHQDGPNEDENPEQELARWLMIGIGSDG